MSNNRKFKSAFSFLIALIIIMQVITPVIAESIQKNDIKPFEVQQSEDVDVEEGNKQEEDTGVKEGNKQEEDTGVKEGNKQEEDMGVEEGNKQEDVTGVEEDNGENLDSEDSKINLNGKELNKDGISNISSDESKLPRDLKKKAEQGFNYNVKLYTILDNEKEEIKQDTVVNIEEINGLNYELKFYVDENFKFVNNDYLKLDITDLINIGIDDIDNLKKYKDLLIKIGNDNELNVGKYNVLEEDNNYFLNIIFTEGEELNDELNNIEGFANLDIYFSKEKIEGSIIEAIEVEGYENKTFTIRRKGEESANITKKGEYNPSDDTITWIIDINTDLADLKDVTIEDELNDRLELINIEIFDLEENKDKNVYYSKDDSNKIIINLGDLGRKAKRIKIKTKILDNNKSLDIKNKATLNFSNFEDDRKSIFAETQVSGSRNIGLEKKSLGYNKDEKTIEWQIDLSLENIKNDKESITITDTLEIEGNKNITLELLDDSIFISKKNGKENIEIPKKTESDQDIYYEIDNNKIIFVIPNEYSDSKIVYKTKVYKLYTINKKESTKNKEESTKLTIKNKAEVEVYNKTYDSSAKQEINFLNDNKKQGKRVIKENETYLEWTITINENNENWKDVKIKDCIPQGFKFVEVKRNDNVIKNLSEDDNCVEIKLDEVAEKEDIVILTKLVDKNEIIEDKKIVNEATVSGFYDYYINNEDIIIGKNPGSGESGTGTEKTPDFEYKVKGSVDGNIFNSSLSKTGKIDNKLVEELVANWAATYTTYKHDINNFTITDKISKDGKHKYDEYSFSININRNEFKLSESEEFQEIIDDNNKKSFKYKLKFKGENEFTLEIRDNNLSNDKDNKVVLKYNTKASLQELSDGKDLPEIEFFSDLDDGFKNSLSNSIKIENVTNHGELSTSAKITFEPILSNNGYKTGKYTGKERIFKWTAYLNHKGKNIQATLEAENGKEKVVIEDTLSPNQLYIEDSIKVYKAKVSALNDDKLIKLKDEEINYEVDLKNNEEVNLNIEDDENEAVENNGDKVHPKMIITFDKLDHPIIIEYETKAIGISESEYTNKISLNGKEYKSSIYYKEYDEFIEKKLLSDRVYIGDIIEWELKVNKSLSDIVNFELTDDMSEGLILLKDSVSILKDDLDVTEDFEIEYINNINQNSEDMESKNQLIIRNKEGIKEAYTVKYKTLVHSNEKLDKISNKVKIEGEYLKEKPIEEVKMSVRSSLEAGGSADKISEEEYLLTIRKIDSSGNIIPSKETKLQLVSITTINNQDYESIKDIKLTNGESINNVIKYNPNTKYYIRELVAPEGYVKLEEDYQIEFNENKKEIEIEVVNYKSEELTEVTAKKVWIGGPKEKPEIEIQLLKNGEKFGEPVKLKDKTEHTFKNLVIRDEGMDKDNIYTVDEVEVPRYYRKSISEDGLTITNTYNYIPSTEDPEDPDDRPYYPENEDKVEKSKKPKTEENNELIKPGSKLPPIIEDNTQTFESNKSKNPGTENNISKQPVNNIKELLPRTGIEGFNYIMILGFILLVFGVINLKKED